MKLPLAILTLTAIALSVSAEPPTYYKGNTHTHSLWSDGNDFPESIVDFYHRNGYDFVGLSDHDIIQEGEKWVSLKKIKSKQRAIGKGAIEKCEALFGKGWINYKTVNDEPGVLLKTLEGFRGKFEKAGEFLIVTAEEISNNSADGPVHMNAVNIQSKIPSVKTKELSSEEVMQKVLKAVEAQEKATGKPILTHLNHPNFQWAITAEALAAVKEERFFEVYNGHPGINHLGDDKRPGDEKIWDIANTIRISDMNAAPLYGMATDDSHTYHGGDVSPGRGWVMVAAKELTGDALVTAMREGKFYSSSGVTLESVSYTPETRTIALKILPDGDATFTSELIGTRKNSNKIGEIFESKTGNTIEFNVPADALYARVTITSSSRHENPSFEGQKQQAWTQPVGWK